MDIVEVDWGVANTYSDKIEINERLREFPELREKIINHELEHSKSKGFWKQRKVDALTELRFRDLFPFYRKYPKNFFQQHSPVIYRNNTLYFEWTLIFLYLTFIGIGFLIYYLIRAFSEEPAFLLQVVKYMVLIFAGIILLYLTGKKLREYINKEAQTPKNSPVV
jgi:hypothetical protein